jgi:monoterpene epsilon-lactone hydrolase
MASPEFERILRVLRANPMDFGSVPLAQLRSRFEAMALCPEPDIDVATTVMASTPVEILTPPVVEAGRTILYQHGGGYVMGSPNTHRRLAGEVARACQATVYLPDYPLAPEHPFPAAVGTITALYQSMLRDGSEPSQLIVVGDSAGGGLTLALLVNLRNAGTCLPQCAVLISPWLDLSRQSYPADLVAADPIVSPEGAAAAHRWYLGDKAAAHELASPLRADLTGLPPILVQVGSSEILLEDSQMLEQSAMRAGVEISIEVWPEMVHVWHAFTGSVPEATQAVAQIGRFVEDHTHQVV